MKTASFNSGWSFTMNGKTTDVTLPHDFMIGLERKSDNITGPDMGYFGTGVGTYVKKFTSDGSAKHTFILFDGVMGLTEVYINNNRVKFHPYGYTAFVCDTDGYLRDGENEIRVLANANAQVSSRWYTGAGIYRDVMILTSDIDYITPFGVYAKTLTINGSDALVEVNIEIESSKVQNGEISIDLCSEKHLRRVHMVKGTNTYSFKITAHDVTLWTPETPVLYPLTVEMTTEHGVKDETTINTGIRTVYMDSKKGFILNGKPVKLYGTCNHHDNGIVGACSYTIAEERRIRILKENGFNAIRTAHNPPSAAMLDACDRMGMLVIDEIFDAWRVGKKDFDYHIWYDAYWKEDTTSMVLRDRNHPCVAIWSTGNEIPEKNGLSDGYKTQSDLVNLIRSLDDSRPVTHVFCSFWDNWEYAQKDNDTRNASVVEMPLDFWAEKTMYSADILDCEGYNYYLDRIEKDEIRFPDRTFAITESYPLDAVLAKKMMDTHPRLFGEFVWTGWDYFGETALGNIRYGQEGSGFYGLGRYPEHISNCGDFDICGFKKAQSYYRDAAWKDGAVTILTCNPDKYGQKYGISAWGFYDCDRMWKYPGQEGKMTGVYVFTMADECELIKDGVSLGRKTPNDKGVCIFDTEYSAGTLKAIAYKNGVACGEDEIATPGDAETITVVKADSNENEITYFEIYALDKDCNVDTCYDGEIEITVDGGIVVATGNGKIDDTHDYTTNKCCAYKGRMLAAVKLDNIHSYKLTASIKGCSYMLTVKPD